MVNIQKCSNKNAREREREKRERLSMCVTILLTSLWINSFPFCRRDKEEIENEEEENN